MSCIVCSFRLASFILRSAVGVTNLLLTKNLVADLQESLSAPNFHRKARALYLQIRFAVHVSNFGKLNHRVPRLGSCFNNVERDLDSRLQTVL